MYRAFTTRASSASVGEGGKSLDNEPHIARILELKKTMAGLLGYESFAEVSLASKVLACLPSLFLSLVVCSCTEKNPKNPKYCYNKSEQFGESGPFVFRPRAER